MEADTRLRMCSFLCIGKTSVFVSLKFHTISDQIIDDIPAATDHDIDTFLAVFIMTGTHRILKIGIIVVLVPQYTDTALCQHRITGFELCF